MELEEAIKILKEDLEHTKKANECGLATRGEFNKEIEAIELILNHLTKQEKMIQKIHENFCKFDWKNSNGEEVHNQLKELYESIFKNEENE